MFLPTDTEVSGNILGRLTHLLHAVPGVLVGIHDLVHERSIKTCVGCTQRLCADCDTFVARLRLATKHIIDQMVARLEPLTNLYRAHCNLVGNVLRRRQTRRAKPIDSARCRSIGKSSGESRGATELRSLAVPDLSLNQCQSSPRRYSFR